jgi:hypothetical protein
MWETKFHTHAKQQQKLFTILKRQNYNTVYFILHIFREQNGRH